MFFAVECDGCIHQPVYSADNICDTEWLSSINQKEDDDYPSELQYGSDGQPCCRRKPVLPSDAYENLSGGKFHFNSPVIATFCHGSIDDRTGRLVQVRKNAGAWGSDLYLLRRNDGSLITGENLRLEKYYGYVSPPSFDTTETEYTVLDKYPETGFIIENPAASFFI